MNDSDKREEFIVMLTTLQVDVSHIKVALADISTKIGLINCAVCQKDIIDIQRQQDRTQEWFKWVAGGLLTWMSALTWWIAKGK